MKPILYYDDRSPPVRSCLMLIKHLNIKVDLKFVDLFKRENLAPDFVQINPVHTVPTLQDGDLILTDSHAILIYLAGKYGGESNLLPKGAEDQAAVINKLFFESCILFRRNADMMGDIFHKRNGEVPGSHEKGVREAYSYLDTFLTDNDFIAQPFLTIADFSVVTTISHLNLIFPMDKNTPRLLEWFERMKQLKSYKEVNLIGVGKMIDALKAYGKLEVQTMNCD